MNLLSAYPNLSGSHGQIRLHLRQSVLDHLCAIFKAQLPDRVRDLRITPRGENRFRVQAELSNALLHWVGSLGLRVLRDDGIDIQIEQEVASLDRPALHGSLDTTVIGRSLAIPKLVRAINDGLGAGDVLHVRESTWLGWTGVRVAVTLHPFPFLRRFLPAGIGHHLTRVQWQTTDDAFVLDLTWHHADQRQPST